jgi:hypothetical protein
MTADPHMLSEIPLSYLYHFFTWYDVWQSDAPQTLPPHLRFLLTNLDILMRLNAVHAQGDCVPPLLLHREAAVSALLDGSARSFLLRCSEGHRDRYVVDSFQHGPGVTDTLRARACPKQLVLSVRANAFDRRSNCTCVAHIPLLHDSDTGNPSDMHMRLIREDGAVEAYCNLNDSPLANGGQADQLLCRFIDSKTLEAEHTDECDGHYQAGMAQRSAAAASAAAAAAATAVPPAAKQQAFSPHVPPPVKKKYTKPANAHARVTPRQSRSPASMPHASFRSPNS